MPKGNNIIMLPGIGTVKVHGDVEGLDMRSFQLVEMTKRITRRTEDCNRTYRLHIQTRTKAPKPSESAVVRGVDMGIVHNATTVDLDTGHPTFYDIPKDCKRTKNDGIFKMHADLSRKRGGSGNRRIRQNGKGDSRGDASKQDKTGGRAASTGRPGATGPGDPSPAATGNCKGGSARSARRSPIGRPTGSGMRQREWRTAPAPYQWRT